jgi:hypothetical protein
MFLARRAMTALAVASLAAGCAVRPVVSSSSSAATHGAATDDMVTAKELNQVRQGSLLDALARVRPSMLRVRGNTPWVSVDGAPPAEISFLRTIQASAVREVHLERVSNAAIIPTGGVIVGDLLVVTTWPGRPDQ